MGINAEPLTILFSSFTQVVQKDKCCSKKDNANIKSVFILPEPNKENQIRYVWWRTRWNERLFVCTRMIIIIVIIMASWEDSKRRTKPFFLVFSSNFSVINWQKFLSIFLVQIYHNLYKKDNILFSVTSFEDDRYFLWPFDFSSVLNE